MRKSFTANRSILSPLWSRPKKPSLQQLRLKNTKAYIWSNKGLAALLDELREDVENASITQQSRAEIEGKIRSDLPWKLPLSPLMDPNLIAARQRHRESKHKLTGKPSALEVKLRENPYAQALASPLRQCGLTGVRLPSRFLITFGVANHPKTGDPWHLPRLSPETFPPKMRPRSEPAVSNPTPNPDEQVHDPLPPTASSSFRFMSGSYYLSSCSALHLLSTSRRKSLIRTLPPRWKRDESLKIFDLVWRQDMDTFVLELLRKHAVKVLKYAATSLVTHLQNGAEDSTPAEHRGVAAVLWLGNPFRSGEDSSIPQKYEAEGGDRTVADSDDPSSASANTTATTEPPPYYATVSHHGAHIPIYNLPVLLGPEHMQSLRTLGSAFEGETTYIKRRIKTVEVQMALWRLMGYMAPLQE